MVRLVTAKVNLAMHTQTLRGTPKRRCQMEGNLAATSTETGLPQAFDLTCHPGALVVLARRRDAIPAAGIPQLATVYLIYA